MNELNVGNKGIATTELDEFGLPVAKVIAQVQRIQQVMAAVMKEGEHYGKIPGCGDKPALLKPGAEKLSLTFRLAPKFEIIVTDLGNGHKEYEIICRLYTIGSDVFVGEGVGSCSTMEGKYRYRSENTGREVPKEYWENRDNRLLGGYDFSPRKVDGKWVIVHRVEHDNPADYYNTCRKIGKKRAQVDAILTATAASDIFIQDVEELVEDGVMPEAPAAKPTVKPPQQKAAPASGHIEPATDIPNDKLFDIEKVTAKSGINKNGNEYTKYDVAIEGHSYSTFDSKLGEAAQYAKENGFPVCFEFKQDGKYFNLTSLTVIEQRREAPAPEAAKSEVPF